MEMSSGEGDILMSGREHLEALGGNFLPWPSGGLSLRAPSESMPDGLRLSTDCPSRRIIEYFDSDGFVGVTDGVSLSGHMYADLFIQSLLGTDDVLVETPVPWACGHTALDAVVMSGPRTAHFELKTSSSKSPKPTKDQRRQVLRQRVVCERAGVYLPQSVIFIIGKSGHFSGFVYGPFFIDPTEEELAETRREIDLVELIFDDVRRDGIDPRDHELIRDLCRCSECFPPTAEEASAEVRELLDTEYSENIPLLKDLELWATGFKDKMRKLIPVGKIVESGKWRVNHTKSGSILIKPRKESNNE